MIGIWRGATADNFKKIDPKEMTWGLRFLVKWANAVLGFKAPFSQVGLKVPLGGKGADRLAESIYKLRNLWELMLLRGARPFKVKLYLICLNNKRD